LTNIARFRAFWKDLLHHRRLPPYCTAQPFDAFCVPVDPRSQLSSGSIPVFSGTMRRSKSRCTSSITCICRRSCIISRESGYCERILSSATPLAPTFIPGAALHGRTGSALSLPTPPPGAPCSCSLRAESAESCDDSTSRRKLEKRFSQIRSMLTKILKSQCPIVFAISYI